MKVVKLERIACDGCGYETMCVCGLEGVRK